MPMPPARLRHAILPLLLLPLLAACDRDAPATGDKPADAPLVEAVAARTGTLPLSERVSGVVKARNQVIIRPEIAAPIVAVHVRSGDRVEQGQPLVTLQTTAAAEQLRQAEAAVALAEAEAHEAAARQRELAAQLGRWRELVREGLVSDLDVETLEARVDAAAAASRQAQARIDQSRAAADEERLDLDRAVVRAPVAGHVGRRNAEVGMLASTTTALFVLGDLDSLTVEVPLTEAMLGRVQVGDPVTITARALPDGAHEARLTRISPFLAEDSFTTLGEVDLANPDGRLRPGMFVAVDLQYGRSDEATIVPAAALWEEPGTSRRGVFVATYPEGQSPAAWDRPEAPVATLPVAFREVAVLAEGRGTVGVRGVADGEWVVVVGQHLLRTGPDALAQVRPATWDRVAELQGLQREDLLMRFLDEQQRWAREHGAEPPDNAAFLGGATR